MINQPELKEIRWQNIIDMGLTFSAMIRLFDKKSKKLLHDQIMSEAKNIFGVSSKEQFDKIHSRFCEWGIRNISLAEKKREGRIIKNSTHASYGQIAKTLDVVLKVAVYYSNLPDFEKSIKICKWINAAVDTKMMAMLKNVYPTDIQPWPVTVEQVDRSKYEALQQIVRKFIKERHDNNIWPVQFDDIYWNKLNR